MPAVGRVSDAAHGARGAVDACCLVGLVRVPEAQRAKGAGGGELSFARIPGQGADPGIGAGALKLSGLVVPEANGIVAAAGDESAAARGELERLDAAAVAQDGRAVAAQ